MELLQKENRVEISHGDFSLLPETPGVYVFWKGKTPIYIGKSINLRSRLRSYLLPNLGTKTSNMVEEAEFTTFIKVFSELESLLLESSLIRKYKPKYNIISKDDKHALYIEITNDLYPRVIPVRKSLIEDPKFLVGPFPSSTTVYFILKMLRKIFPFADHKLGKKTCLYSHLGLCKPCPNYIQNQKDLNEREELRREYLKNIRNVKLILSRRFNFLKKNLLSEMKKESKYQNFEKAKTIRDQIKALDYITQPRIAEERFLENPNLEEDIRHKELVNLTKLLKTLKPEIKLVKRIECFDIAHLSGLHTTASMVTFIDGVPEKKFYRHFRIRQKSARSDYDSMREVALRRKRNLQKWGSPDLIVVDGGLGQVNIFNEVFKDLQIPVIGISKLPDKIVLSNGQKLRKDVFALRLLQRMRDEAHRFARRYHHFLLKKSLIP